MNAVVPQTSDSRLGIDVYSLRSQGWDAFRVLEYCRDLDVKVVHFSEPRLLGSMDKAHLLSVRRKAEELSIDLEIGMLSFCPTSVLFDAALGTAEEQLSRMIEAARIVGSPIVRAVVGNAMDRRGAIPFDETLRNAIAVLRHVRQEALDCGVKIAVENHSGDMQSAQLRMLIEAVGPEFVGACIDSGNPLITLEDPHAALETLAPYVLTSHVRDTAVWLTAEGAETAWVRMGEGNVNIDFYVQEYLRLCAGRALSLEVIVSPKPRPFPFRSATFWDAYRDVPAWQFQRFLEIAETGKPAVLRALRSGETAADRERENLEASMRYLKSLVSAESVPPEFPHHV